MATGTGQATLPRSNAFTATIKRASVWGQKRRQAPCGSVQHQSHLGPLMVSKLVCWHSYLHVEYVSKHLVCVPKNDIANNASQFRASAGVRSQKNSQMSY